MAVWALISIAIDVSGKTAGFNNEGRYIRLVSNW